MSSVTGGLKSLGLARKMTLGRPKCDIEEPLQTPGKNVPSLKAELMDDCPVMALQSAVAA